MMLLLKDGLFHTSQLSPFSPFSSSVFVHAVIFLLTHSSGGCFRVVGPPSPVVALVGEEVLLPCRLEPAADAVSMIVEWGRPDLKPRFVHVWHEGQNLLVNQNPSYKGRTSVSTDKLKLGDLSLKLNNIKHSDRGTYRCLLPKLNRESNVELIVGVVSLPVITGINISSEKKVLQCESKGWYPEPEVLWLDGERNLLSAGPTETSQGPGGLFAVSSRVTVEKRESNSFTCRVQQRNINQTRETHIQISGLLTSDECSMESLSCAARISITLAAVLACAVAVVLIVWRRKQNKTKIALPLVEETGQTGQGEPLMVRSESKDNAEGKKTTPDEEMQKKKEIQEHFGKVVAILQDQEKELGNQADQLKNQKEEMERGEKEAFKKLQKVEEHTKKDRGQGYFKLKEIILHQNKDVQQRKQGIEKLEINTENLLIQTRKVLRELNGVTEQPGKS